MSSSGARPQQYDTNDILRTIDSRLMKSKTHENTPIRGRSITPDRMATRVLVRGEPGEVLKRYKHFTFPPHRCTSLLVSLKGYDGAFVLSEVARGSPKRRMPESSNGSVASLPTNHISSIQRSTTPDQPPSARKHLPQPMTPRDLSRGRSGTKSASTGADRQLSYQQPTPNASTVRQASPAKKSWASASPSRKAPPPQRKPSPQRPLHTLQAPRSMAPAPRKTATGLWMASPSHVHSESHHDPVAANIRASGSSQRHNQSTTHRNQMVSVNQSVELGTMSADELGLLDNAFNPRTCEHYVRQRLHRLNLRDAPGAQALDDPLRSGVILCQLIRLLARDAEGQKLPFVPAPNTIADAKANWRAALEYLRSLDKGARISPTFVYLNTDDVLRGHLDVLWGLMYHTLECLGVDDVQGTLISSETTTYSPRHMVQLEAALCNWIHALGLLYWEPSWVESPVPPGPTKAPRIGPRSDPRPAPPPSLSMSTVFPFICNGTLLSELYTRITEDEPQAAPLTGTIKNPRTPACCLANLHRAIAAFQSLQPRMSPMYLANPTAIYEGDKAYIMLLLEDALRFFEQHEPRQRQPQKGDAPYIPKTSRGHQHLTTGGPGDMDLNTSVLSNPAMGMTEKQHFSANQKPRGNASNRMIVMETDRNDVQAVQTTRPFAVSSIAAPPLSFQTHNTTPVFPMSATGRSTVASEAPLPRQADSVDLGRSTKHTYAYLENIRTTDEEIGTLQKWFKSKLPDVDINLDGDPVAVFEDGVNLANLVNVLMYFKSNFRGVQVQGLVKTKAARRNNLRRVLEYLKEQKKILTECMYLEEALMDGDKRAVIVVLRTLKRAFRNHVHHASPQASPFKR